MGPAFIITDVEQYDANHIFSQEALDDTCWTFSMSYSMDGDATLQKEPLERSALTVTKKQFMLKEKPFRILSGSIHYFRVVPEYWRDRLLKLKAMGLNTVET